MSNPNKEHQKSKHRVAIACGGTGGHLFPGLAVANELIERGCSVTLLISPKEVDQQAVKSARGMAIVTLPAVGLTQGNRLAFFRGFISSFFACRKLFRKLAPEAVIAFGGFTSAPPVLAGRLCGARTYLHESNAIPGRANRWLARLVHRAFVGFPACASRLNSRRVTVTGTPVRQNIRIGASGACRVAMGLDSSRPVALVMGGSQGASGLNKIVIESLPLIAKSAPQLQWLHLTGPNDATQATQAYEKRSLSARVYPFLDRMDLALGAATLAISRAGASSLAEIAALRIPSVLIPYPAATDNHQFHNAAEFVNSGAAHLLEQKSATPELLARIIIELLDEPSARDKMQAGLGKWHHPDAAARIAETIITELGAEDAAAQPVAAMSAAPAQLSSQVQ